MMCSIGIMKMETGESTANRVESDASAFLLSTEMDYRCKLKKIDEGLVKKDVERLKFLCRDLIGASVLEEIQRGIELFQELEAKQKLRPTNVTYLAECLLTIERADLLRPLGIDISDLRHLIYNHEEVSKYRKILLEIADDLMKKEVSTLVYLAKAHLNHRGFVLSKMKADKITSPFQLFLTLEQSECMSSVNVRLLARLLNEIGRPDLCQKAQIYQGIVEGSQFELPPPSVIEGLNEEEEGNMAGDEGNMAGDEDNRAVSVREAQAVPNTSSAMDFYCNTSYITEGVKQMNIEPVIPPEPPKLSEYEMNARPRGYCLIINNVTFYSMRGDPYSRELRNREGSHIDASDLSEVFQGLDFLVEVQEDLTDTEMVRVCTEFAMRDHTDFDCFVCCILTHGEHGSLFGCNGNPCQITEITSCFKAQRCPGLRGKPKMFFLQACQGKQKQNGFLKGIEMDANEQSVETIPDEADFLLGYATVPGFVSYRSETHGSWYITKLCENLRNFGLMYDLLSILTKVNEEVSMCSYGQFKQVPAPMHTLRKRIHFR